MNANYAKICRVDNLEADFQQFPLVQFFSEIFTISLWNINNSNSAKKSKKKNKNIFLVKLLNKSLA